MTFFQKLDAAIDINNSLLCVGLDPEFDRLPANIQLNPNPQFEFNKYIIDATHDLVSVYKPNSAFYESRGAEGLSELKMTCEYIKQQYPKIPIILDYKRADIGNTNNGYVSFAYEYIGADAVTLHPYLGSESIKPFLEKTDKGNFVLCRTSNPGAGEVQDLIIDNEPLYKHVARLVTTSWNSNNNCGLVIGATYPEELKAIRTIAPEMVFLVPGIGAQGGDLENTLKNGLRTDKKGLIISSSRGIIFANEPREEAIKLKDQINSFR